MVHLGFICVCWMIGITAGTFIWVLFYETFFIKTFGDSEKDWKNVGNLTILKLFLENFGSGSELELNGNNFHIDGMDLN